MNKTLSAIGFRFIFLLCILFVLFNNNGSFVFYDLFARYTFLGQSKLAIWFGEHILHLAHPVDIRFNGSGDTTFFYILLLIILTLSVTGTIIWSALDRKRTTYPQLFYWLIVILRFYVGFMLVHYGLAKLNNGQFPGPSPNGMIQTYGDSTPMGLAWRFLGYSEGYKTFMFVAEMMGILLFFRRTATIGAILCLMTSLNIMAINYFFDVPVKILSTALVLMCLIILSPNLIRLFRLFFLGEAIKLDQLQAPIYKNKWKKVTGITVKYLAIALCAGIPIIGTAYTSLTKKAEAKEALYGAYKVARLEWAVDTPPAMDSLFVTKGWKLLIFDSYDRAFVKYGDNETIYGKAQFELDKKSLTLSFNDQPDVRYRFSYLMPIPGVMELKGELFDKRVTIRLEKKEFELTKQGFRWINEHPYNR